MSKHMFRGIDAETDAMIDEIERKASSKADDELRKLLTDYGNRYARLVGARQGDAMADIKREISEAETAIMDYIQTGDEQRGIETSYAVARRTRLARKYMTYKRRRDFDEHLLKNKGKTENK